MGYFKRQLYKLTFPNGYVYIGCTNDVRKRWAGRGRGYMGLPPVHDAIKEFGWENVEKKIIAQLPDTVESNTAILAFEKELIEAYAGRCYNSKCNPEWIKNVEKRRGDKNRKRIYWVLDGVQKPASECCTEYGVSYGTVSNRMKKHGLTLMQALTFPAAKGNDRRDPVKYWKELGLFGREPSGIV